MVAYLLLGPRLGGLPLLVPRTQRRRRPVQRCEGPPFVPVLEGAPAANSDRQQDNSIVSHVSAPRPGEVFRAFSGRSLAIREIDGSVVLMLIVVTYCPVGSYEIQNLYWNLLGFNW